MNSKNLISVDQLGEEKIAKLLYFAGYYSKNPVSNDLEGKTIACLFFEPSTRTRLSFESAIRKLNGKVVGFSDSSNSSVSKGETLEDTIKTVNNYCDAIVMRHPENGAAERAVAVSEVPIINAGDGSNEHPTQTLLDLYSIQETQGTLKDLTVGLAGDLKYGRTVHSLIKALLIYGVKFVLIAPKELQLPGKLIQLIENSNSTNEYRGDFSDISDLDVLYMTRTQRERFDNIADYEKVKDLLQLKLSHVKNVKDNFKILHPLPRVDEMEHSLDDHESAYYFQQTLNGLHMRQALLADLFD